MGFDVGRFTAVVDEELLCPICSCVLELPLQLEGCEHAFCAACIRQWITRGSPTCPVDRQQVTPQQLQPVPRILKNLLSRLEIRCDNHSHGCESVLRLDALPNHLKDCAHNPKRPVPCERGCGLTTIPLDEMSNHNCVKELRAIISGQDEKISALEGAVRDAKYQLAENRRDINILKDQVRANFSGNGEGAAAAAAAQNGDAVPTFTINGTRSFHNLNGANRNNSFLDRLRVSTTDGDPPVSGAAAPGTAPTAAGATLFTLTASSLTARMQEADAISNWCNSLPRAKVTRWGGMISTPNTELQAQIRRTLAETGCPQENPGNATSTSGSGSSGSRSGNLLDDLMANAHERRWPPGLLTLETRQMNRRQYERYICRRVPGRQAVVVMACDNAHMSDDMIIEPGIVMIFAHGIE